MCINRFVTLLLLLFIVFISACNSGSTTTGESLQLIPTPHSITTRPGSLDASEGFNLQPGNLTEEMARNLSDYLNVSPLHLSDNGKLLSMQLSENEESSDNGELSESEESGESYVLTIDKKGVFIQSTSEIGLFYGLQTLMQLVQQDKNIPYLEIKDKPRFAYRGLHLDVSRHFFSLDFLKKQIDRMAHYKLNKFHLHLTDAAGWRLEIDAYPELTGIAAWRAEELWKDWWASDRKYVAEGTPGAYGGVLH